MTIACDPGHAVADEAGDPAPMTLQAARSLAATLAPHLAAMRAVTAGTRYADKTDIEVASESAGDGPRPVSPTTMIFIAGMLERLAAERIPALT